MISDNIERQRFEMEEGGRLVYASYRIRDGAHALVHVEADPALRGTGAAGRFMAELAAHARANGLKLVPYCPYARVWFGRHPEAVKDLAPSSEAN